jgi:hypothetical protein
MFKILFRIACALLVVHGTATFVAGRFLPIAAIGDRLLFAQHGFAFVFLALLNLVIWQPVLRGPFLRSAVHVCNFAFTLFYTAISLRNSEPPNVIAMVLVGTLFLVGLVLERGAHAATGSSVV